MRVKNIILSILMVLMLASVGYCASGTFSIQEDGGGDYTSLKTAVETEAANLTGTGKAIFNVTESWTNPDTGNWDIDGYTTTSSDYIEINFLGDSTHTNGVINATGWRTGNKTQIFDIEQSYTVVNGLQDTDYGGTGVDISGASAGVVINNFILASTNLAGGANGGVRSASTGVTLNNGIIYKTWEAGDTGTEGIYTSGSGTIVANNMTISGFDEGVQRAGDTITISNSAIFNNNTDYDGTITADYNATDDGGGTNGVDISPGGTEADDWNAAFTDYSNGDFTVKDTSSVLYNTGSATYAPATDIIGTSRPQSTDDDIGAFELIAEAPSTTPQIITVNISY